MQKNPHHPEILVRNGFGVISLMIEFECSENAQTCGTGCGAVLLVRKNLDSMD